MFCSNKKFQFQVLDDDELYLWSDGTPTSRYVGFWRQDQPNFLNGSCALGKVERKDLEWRLDTCNLLRRFVCERPACVQGSYFCSSGSCISESKKCNGHNDCDDGSDEQNCPSAFQPNCRTYEKGESGQLSSTNYPNSYDPNLNCRHVLEGPINSRIELTIEHFETEPDFDILTVLDGGPAENSTTGRFQRELHLANTKVFSYKTSLWIHGNGSNYHIGHEYDDRTVQDRRSIECQRMAVEVESWLVNCLIRLT